MMVGTTKERSQKYMGLSLEPQVGKENKLGWWECGVVLG